MSINNGAKRFLYVIRHEHEDKGDGGTSMYLVRSDHDPDVKELISALDLDYEPENGETLDAQRYDLDSIPTVPPKKA